MIESVKLPAGITVGSACLPEPPAPMKRCWARLKPSVLASSNAAQSGFLSLNRPTYFFMMSSIGTPSSSFGRGWRATLMGLLPLILRKARISAECAAQGALDHDAKERLAIGAGGVNVVRRIDGCRRR